MRAASAEEEQVSSPSEAEEALIGPPVPPWPVPQANAGPPPREPAGPAPRELLQTRIRLLLLAGLAGPIAMVLIGVAFAWFVRGEQLWALLTRFGAPLPTLAGAALSAGCSMGLVGLMHRLNKTFARALRRSGTRVAEETLKVAGYPVMLVVVAMAGVGEEFLFRGGLQPTVGIVAAAVIFGLSHGGWRREMWAYVVAATGAGLVYGLAYHWTGQIWVPVIGHAVHNVISVLSIGRKLDITFERGRLRVRWVKEAEGDEDE